MNINIYVHTSNQATIPQTRHTIHSIKTGIQRSCLKCSVSDRTKYIFECYYTQYSENASGEYTITQSYMARICSV